MRLAVQLVHRHDQFHLNSDRALFLSLLLLYLTTHNGKMTLQFLISLFIK